MKLNGSLLAAIDFETTGLLAGYHEPVQVAIVVLGDNLRPLSGVAPFYELIRPEHIRRIDAGAMNIHGIPLQTLQDAPESQDIAERLYEWHKSLPLPVGRGLTPLAHPWAFEYGFLTAWLGMPLFSEVFERNARCSKAFATGLNDRAARAGRPLPFKRVNLDWLCEHFGVVNPHPHDALWDALVEAEVYRCLTALS